MPPTDDRTFLFEGFALDLKRGCLSGADGEIELRPKSFEVLRYLVANAGRLVPKDELMGAVWPNVFVTDESLARCVSDVRLALGDRQQRIIKTVPRRGYLLTVPTVQPRSAGGPAGSSSADAAVDAGTPATRLGRIAALSLEQEPPDRRQLTVMACELAGLAAAAVGSDPEDLRVAVAECRKHCSDLVEKHGGYVARYFEQGMLAYFGYPLAQERDAENAVRAGLALIGSAGQLSAVGRTPLQLRVVVATGVVVMAAETVRNSRERTAVGETLHLAGHLQTIAGRGDLLLDQGTRRLVRGLFDYEEIAPVAVDGYPRAVRGWRVLGASGVESRFEARREVAEPAGSATSDGSPANGLDPAVNQGTFRGLTPFVGRVHELGTLAECVEAASARLRVVDIVGEPGIGKSRLLHEFARRLAAAGTRIWLGNCWPDSQQVPFRPFIEIVRRTFGIGAGDAETDVARKVDAGLAQLGLATAVNLGLMLNLLGLTPSPGALRGLDDVLVGLRTRDLLLQLVREGSRAGPVVLVLEDLHWIDGASQDLLARLIDIPDIGGLAIIHTRRPEYAAPWCGGPSTRTLPLEPMPAGETSQIVQARFGVPELGGMLSRLIVDRAEGNPLFAEEIANFLLESRIIRRWEMGLDYDAAAVAEAVPASITSLLTARADRMATSDRMLLQTAAVIGRRFSSELLAAVAGSADVQARLAAIEDLDLVRRDESAGDFVFKHALVRDALYASLLSGARQSLHMAIATEVERRNSGRLSEVAEILAHHYARADHRTKAVEYLSIVGRKSIGIYSLDEGEHFLKTALDLARSQDRERMDSEIASILVDLAVVFYFQFRSADTIALIEPELDRIATLGDAVQVAILMDLYGVALFTACRFRDSKPVAEAALAMAERLGDARSKAHARAGAMMISIYTDPMPLVEFEKLGELALLDAEACGQTYLVSRIMMVLATNYLHLGLAIQVRECAERLMKFGQDRQDLRSQGEALWLFAWCEITAENFAGALAHGEECMRTALAPYDRQLGQSTVGMALLLLGRVAEGRETIESHRRTAILNGWTYAVVLSEAPLAVATILSGELRKGVRLLEALIRRCETEIHYQPYADWTRVFLAEFYIALLRRTRKPPLRVILKNLLFLVVARRLAARRAEALLLTATRNRQLHDQGVHRGRIEYNLGLIYAVTERRDLARAHLDAARDIGTAQGASALIAKIDAAMALL